MAAGFDTPYISDLAAKAEQVKDAGFSWAAGYLFEGESFKQRLALQAAQQLSAAGLYVVSLWECGTPTSRDYFLTTSGSTDARCAVHRAQQAGQPGGVIYFTVDYNAFPEDLDLLATYFSTARATLAPDGFTAGIYGNGLVCLHLSQLGLVSHTWLSGSTGWIGYAGWHASANIVQTKESTSLLGIACDFDQSNAALGGGGWKTS